MSYLKSKQSNQCSGCGSCANVCAHNAISMREDNEGFLFPHIDPDSCVGCGLCEKACPVDKEEWANRETLDNCYMGTAKDFAVSANSATQGVCTEIGKAIIRGEGIVYGAELRERPYKVFHIPVTTRDGLERIRNSKYIQSNTGITFKEVRGHLKKGFVVLYIGTPCEIAGLKAFLRCDYKNLYTIDLVCHGTYSYKLIDKEVEYWENKFHGRLYNFKFRSKKKYPWAMGGVVNFDIECNDGKKTHIERFASCSPTYSCYAANPQQKNYNFREICYACPFRSYSRYGDLTVGDGWMIDSFYPDYFHRNSRYGFTVVSCNTLKGDRLFSLISEKYNLKKIFRKEMFAQSALQCEKRIIPFERYEIYNNLEKEEYGQLISRVIHVDFDKEVSRIDREMMLVPIKKIIKKVLLYKYWRKIFKK